MRTLVDISDDNIRKLDALAAASRRSRAAEIREAVDRHIRHKTDRSWIEAGAGYWKNRADVGDGLAYQYAVREDRDEP